MKKYIVGLVVILALALGGWLLVKNSTTEAPEERIVIASALYICDADRTINATFFKQSEADVDEMVEVSLDGGASTTLPHVISASGARYANADESFVFWNKGDEALIMRDNEMDLNYINCTSGPREDVQE